MALSDGLKKLADRAKEAEMHAAQARDKTKADLERAVSSARTSAQAQADRMRRDAHERHEKAATWWAGVQESWNEHVAKAREKLESRKAAGDARMAQMRADDAEAYATFAIDLAYSAVVEAEYAVLDADLARAEANEASRRSTAAD
jgi:TPP-dependent trihydroxycyclohexane-1,2-dione (THcHDO) dehydratase